MKTSLVLFLFLLISRLSSCAQDCQGTNVACVITHPLDSIRKAQEPLNWDWEICPTDEKWCLTWTIKDGENFFVARSPWTSRSGELTLIVDGQDYTKKKVGSY